MKKVCCIIVTFNGEKWIEKCLNSLQNSSFPVQIIIVDNCSSDNTLKIASNFENNIIIKSDTNLGFGKANNIGIQKGLELDFDYFFLLNQDTFVYENTIENLVAELNENPDYGIISPLHYSPDEKTLDANFQTYLNRSVTTEKNLKKVYFVNAAAWLVSKKCIEKTGFFEQWFSHYGEDRNYCNRILYHGFSIGISEKSKIVHDRIIKRNFKKDVIQSKYTILATFLDINKSLVTCVFSSLRQVFGLPKYFLKFYSFPLCINLFFNLLFYYIILILNIPKVLRTRAKHKNNV